MIGKYQRRNLLVDEIEIQALLLRNRIADMIQDEFAREMNYIVYEEARRCCEGCQIDNPSQLHHDCMMKEQEEIWICHYEEAKKHLKLDKVWSAIEEQIHKKLDVVESIMFYIWPLSFGDERENKILANSCCFPLR